MIVLGIETSCDETAAAVVKDGKKILSSVVSSQIDLHKPYLGVVPELASRAHVQLVNAVVDEALRAAKTRHRVKKVDRIAVTVGPGLVGALLVGRMTAETLGWAWKVPVMGVNHLEGHLLSPILSHPFVKPPFLGLIVSGGHTEIIVATKWNSYKRLGRTRDDAAGEAFDKVAKMMGLGYPGGPVIDRLAKKGNPALMPLPRPWLPGTWDFSFSGLKTAVLYKLREKKKWSQRDKENLCASFQESVVDVLVGKTMAAAKALRMRTIIVGGGVAANSLLRTRLIEAGAAHKIKIFMATPEFCTDNASMIASAAFFKHSQRTSAKTSLRVHSQLHFPLFSKTPLVFIAPKNA